jgi:Domain of unknown function (DUF1918)
VGPLIAVDAGMTRRSGVRLPGGGHFTDHTGGHRSSPQANFVPAPMPDELPDAIMMGMATDSRQPSDRLRARAGDRLVIQGHHEGEPKRDAEILEVMGSDGGPPFRVRWESDGHESICYPGSDAYVEHLQHRRRPST